MGRNHRQESMWTRDARLMTAIKLGWQEGLTGNVACGGSPRWRVGKLPALTDVPAALLSALQPPSYSIGPYTHSVVEVLFLSPLTHMKK